MILIDDLLGLFSISLVFVGIGTFALLFFDFLLPGDFSSFLLLLIFLFVELFVKFLILVFELSLPILFY